MSAKTVPRQELKEYFLEIKLTKRKHIVVEGPADQRFIRVWLDGLGGTYSEAAVTAVTRLEVPTSDVLALDLNDSNRSRVIVVAAKAFENGVDLRCVADKDCGHDVEEHVYETLIWTDYPAMESYAVEPKALDTANLLSFGGLLPPADKLLDHLSFALRELFAVRLHNQHLEKPNYKAGLQGRRATLNQFDVSATVHVSIRDAAKGYERPTGSDPRTFAYGHDVGELLLAAYGNELQNRAGLRGLAAVEGALRSAVHAAGTFIEEELFLRLQGWIAGDDAGRD